MAGAGLHVRLEGLEQLQPFFDRLRGVDLRPLNVRLGALVASQSEERIATGKRSPEGDAWAALSEGYAARKRKGGILELEGDLRDSIVSLVSGGTVEVGTNLVYAATHQYGDEDRGIAERAFLGLSGADEAELSELIVAWVSTI